MTATLPEVVCELLSFMRVRDGVPTPVELCVRFDGDTLSVSSDWSGRQGTWLQTRFYAVREFTTDWPGRGFSLAKKDESHELFLSDDGPEFDTCSCRGSERFNYCCHRASLRFLTDGGHL